MNSFGQALSNDTENYANTLGVLRDNEIMGRNHAIDKIEDLKDNYEAASKTILEVTGLAEVAGGGKVLQAGKSAIQYGAGKLKGILGGAEDGATEVSQNLENLGSKARSTFGSVRNTFKSMLGKANARVQQGVSDVKPGSFLDRNPGAQNISADGSEMELSEADQTANKIRGMLKSRGPGFDQQKISTRNSLNADPDADQTNNLQQSSGESKQSTGESKSSLGDDLDQETKTQDPKPSNNDLDSKGIDKDGNFQGSEDEDDGEEEALPEEEEGDEELGGFLDAIGLPEIGGFFQIAGALTGAGIGIADAVKSGLAGDAATTLRDKALPGIKPPGIDVGGSLVAPTTSSVNQ